SHHPPALARLLRRPGCLGHRQRARQPEHPCAADAAHPAAAPSDGDDDDDDRVRDRAAGRSARSRADPQPLRPPARAPRLGRRPDDLDARDRPVLAGTRERAPCRGPRGRAGVTGSRVRSLPLTALVTAELISNVGSQMTFLALPWFVLQTTGSTARMGLVIAADLAPMALLGIPSGTAIARLGARRAMLTADFARAPLIASIPVLHSAGALSFPLLLVIVALVGCFNAPYFAAQRVVLPEIVGEDEQAVGL